MTKKITPEERKTILETIALKEVLNVKETAVLTGKCANAIYILVRQNLIPYHKPDGQGNLFFDKAKILAWMRGEWNGNSNTNE